MATNMIRLLNQKSNTDVAMNAKDAAKNVLNFSNTPLDLDDQAKIAVGCYEETNREDGSEILKLYEMNSDVNCAIIALLNNDTSDTREKLCDAIKTAFVDYFNEQINQSINEAEEERFLSAMEDHGGRIVIDQATGEAHYVL